MRPYYNDPYTVEFDALVARASKKGEEFVVALDTSYFYPTSGGQEHDTGFIGGQEVLDVFEEDGMVLHVVPAEVRPGKVTCRIDWARRFANMQQHTGQHILSAAFENLFGIETVSSRLGEYTGTIDLSRQPTEDEVARAVEEANKVVRENRPVTVHFADRDNIASFKLRKPPKVEGTVRIIDVKDFDMSPCGGTHCTHTSEIGMILTGNVEKVKSALTRIEFFCGDRASRRYYELLKSARESSRNISATIEELPTAVEKLKNQLHEKESRIKFLGERMLEDVCEKMAANLEKPSADVHVTDLSSVLQTTEELRFVASCVSRRVKSTFAFHRVEGNVCYMNLNLVADDKTAAAVLDELRSKCGVKGGGRNGFYSIAFDKSRMEDVVALVKGGLRHD